LPADITEKLLEPLDMLFDTLSSPYSPARALAILLRRGATGCCRHKDENVGEAPAEPIENEGALRLAADFFRGLFSLALCT
jgi:hypothetical protein